MQIFIVIPLVFVIILVLIDSIKNVRIEKLRNQVYLSALEKKRKSSRELVPRKKSQSAGNRNARRNH